MASDYTADDRDRDEKDEPGSPDLDALQNLWSARDVRYTQRKARLTEAQISAVRAFRILETRDLPVTERAAGYREAMSWVPPVVVS